MQETPTKNQELTENLKEKITGDVWSRGDAGYETARAAWNLIIDHQPDLIVVAQSEQDVVEAVRFAREHDLPVAVQATGHGQPRHCREGMLLVVRNLNTVQIDPVAKTATVGGGTKWGEVIPLACEHGLLPVSGSAPDVGVVGYTVGGGYGILSRKLGLASDSVLSFRIVTPQGELKVASPSENADLFWAVLGGGGAYGVITQMTQQLYEHGDLFAGSVMFDASLAEDVYPAYVAWTKTLPDEVSSAINMITFPPVPFVPEFLHGRSMVIVVAAALADPAQAEKMLAPIRNMPGAEFDAFRPMSYTESGDIYRDPVDPLPVRGRGVLIKDLDETTIREFLAAVGPASQSPNLMIQIRHLDGAMAKPGRHPNSTADRRQAKYLVYFLGVPMGPVTPQMMTDHAEGAFNALGDAVYSRGPLNFLGEGEVASEDIRHVYAADEYARLQAIKHSVDPSNRFRWAGVGLKD
ncbi:MAG: FAD-binding oxidoreductase [Fimbriimonadaceae bacterium]|nr:FAD-binding oxidoreductase [Fimbriimonadaceae bacterium]